MTSVLHLTQYARVKRAERRKTPKLVAKRTEVIGFVVGYSNGLTVVSAMLMLARLN